MRCTSISMFHVRPNWNRTDILNYCEVYLRVPLVESERRDPKGPYARARQGALSDVAGLDHPVDEPRPPDLIVDNHGTIGSADAAALIWRRFAGGKVVA